MGAVASGGLAREDTDCSLRAGTRAAQQALRGGQRGRERRTPWSYPYHDEYTIHCPRGQRHGQDQGQGQRSSLVAFSLSSSRGTPSDQEHSDRTRATCATAIPSTNQQRPCPVARCPCLLHLPQRPGQPERGPKGRMMSGCAGPTWLLVPNWVPTRTTLAHVVAAHTRRT